MAKKLHKCKSGKDFVKYAERAERRGDCRIRKCKSSHVLVKKPGYGAMTVPVHANKDLKPGLRRAVLRWMVAAGLILSLLAGLAGCMA